MTAYCKLIPAAAMLMAGCASAAALTTPSGNPEITLKGKTQQEAIEHIATYCASNGRTVENQTTNMVTCTKTMDNIMMQTMLGAGQSKHQFLVSKQGNDLRVMMSSAWIESTNGFGAIQRYPVDIRKGKTAQEAQASLNRMFADGE